MSTAFSSVFQKLHSWIQSPDGLKHPFALSGLHPEQWAFLLKEFSKLQKKHLFITETEDQAFQLAQSLENLADYFPGLSHSPYSSILSSESDLLKRMSFLCSEKRSPFIITSIKGLHLKLPPKHFFENSFKIELSDIISPIELAKKLVEWGFQSAQTVEEPGQFSRRGEIFDIYPLAHPPIRLGYFDDMIEEIHEIDPLNQKTKRDQTFDQVRIFPSTQIFLQKKYQLQLRDNIPRAPLEHRKKLEHREYLFNQLSDQKLFENYSHFVPLFFNESSSLLDYLSPQNYLIHFIESENISTEQNVFFETLREDFESQSLDLNSDQVLPEPSKLFYTEGLEKIKNYPTIQTNLIPLSIDLESNLKYSISLKTEESSRLINNFYRQHNIRKENLYGLFQYIKEFFSSSGEVFLCFQNALNQEKINRYFEELEYSESLKKRVHLSLSFLSQGFYTINEKTLIVSESDFFKQRSKNTAKTQRHDDLFAEQIASLKEGDFVVHATYGVGIYRGMQSMSSMGKENDFFVLDYKDGDKVYVPVYKMNLLQKYADSSSKTPVDNLKSKKFEQAKSKARQSVKKLAFDLLELQAKREATPGFSYSEMGPDLEEFEAAFPYTETPDQAKAIEDVYRDMEKSSPMDRLICGDVGFGKTEVAMRAAMKAVLDHKQVVVLVPTTILCLQHEYNFKERFKKFPVEVESLSRFKSTQQSKEIIEKLKEGKIDIVIGTHKLLSQQVRFSDLGLLIIDEEHRFGVSHKEKMKVLKAHVDVLTMSATPIPRTMQLSYLGIKDLSSIQTPPPRRQSIKSYLIKEDEGTIKQAIERELSRGGQIFYVHNRVQDIENVAGSLRELIPDAKIVIGHGQLPEKELEKRIQAFYQHKYDILLATTIIESGIDIPMANTMIVSRSDRFGLAQLHQLRGRIGRSDRKAYCYFSIPTDRRLTGVAEKRLKALQTYADMGSGFSIASSDLEIRGAGDILGAEQSGHIHSIGLELYLDLLKDAIQELKGEESDQFKDIEIQTHFPASIPESFISDDGNRLRYYKRLSNCHELEKLYQLRAEIEDIYGELPQDFINLLYILEARIELQKLYVSNVKVLKDKIRLVLDQRELDLNPQFRDQLVKNLLKKPNTYKFSPDYKVTISVKDSISGEVFLTKLARLKEDLNIS
ncbi:MAG: transcription-repair coupling factor [Halobacteriovoraceae bacterium]|nr:transcription-repair coupling factor [Halobacteriovoraceae bacterium]